jgi:penicillin-binding protein 1A
VRRIRKLRLLAVLAVLATLAATTFMFGHVVSIRAQIPKLDPANRHDQENGVVYANDGKTVLMVLRGSESRTVVADDQISPWIKYAIVAIEDRRFWEHRGIDLRGILRAAWQDVTSQRVVEGGSTITQQFVKRSFTGSQRSIARKIKEAAFAWQLSQKWSKTRILDAYLNTIYFGNQAYGIEQASRIYFGHSAKKLTIAQAALLAGIPQDPTAYDPIAHPEAARARRHEVLQAMLEQPLIPRDDFRKADRQPLPTEKTVHQPAVLGQAPYFAHYVRAQLGQVFPQRVDGGGLRVKTTIDLGLQRLARDAVQKWLPSPDGPQAALVALDVKSGAVLAMVGGRNYHDSQFNLATQENRQVGSAFKPFVLATALREGVSPQTVLDSHPVQIDLGDRVWSVHNYEGEYMGPIDLTTAMVHSDNSVYAQLTALVGPKNVAKTAKLLGIDGLRGYFSIGLGAQGVSPLDMARAYSSFANGGYRVEGSLTGNRPRVVDCLLDDDGRCATPNAVVPKRALGENAAATIDQILQGVVASGTGTAAQIPGRAVAGKTGTTENEGDAWFVGFTPRIAVAVWVGYPAKLQPMLTEFHGSPVVGGTYPALIFKSFLEQAADYLKLEPQSFPSPQSLYASSRSVVLRGGKLQLDNGHCENTRSLVLYSGTTLPTADCKLNEVEVPNVVGQSLAAAKARLEAQPLTPAVVYKPARTGQRVGRVLGQMPKGGTLSSHDRVTLVLAKPLHGVVPKVVGLPVAKAQERLARRNLRPAVHGNGARIVSQKPAAGVAAGPGMQVTLVAAAG